MGQIIVDRYHQVEIVMGFILLLLTRVGLWVGMEPFNLMIRRQPEDNHHPTLMLVQEISIIINLPCKYLLELEQ